MSNLVFFRQISFRIYSVYARYRGLNNEILVGREESWHRAEGLNNEIRGGLNNETVSPDMKNPKTAFCRARQIVQYSHRKLRNPCTNSDVIQK